MEISLQSLIPLPLKDRPQHALSQIWRKQSTFHQGEWIKIQAPSGTGKTSFQHILYGIRQDYEGAVIYNHQNLKDFDENALALLRQQQLSVIFQDLKLFGNLTALENIELKRLLSPGFRTAESIQEMAILLGIDGIMHQPAAICSYGEQQRIAIIRALMQPFEWLIMDEPFSHLDDANIQKAAALIASECKARGAGLIITDLEADNHFPYQRQLFL
jgi:ABC-type lipoprotein export system ATPase subunit